MWWKRSGRLSNNGCGFPPRADSRSMHDQKNCVNLWGIYGHRSRSASTAFVISAALLPFALELLCICVAKKYGSSKTSI